MGAYFKPWRRRIGVLTLVLACVFVGVWFRSQFLADAFFFWARGTGTYSIHSLYGTIKGSISHEGIGSSDSWGFDFTSNAFRPFSYTYTPLGDSPHYVVDGNLRWMWFEMGQIHERVPNGRRCTFVEIPYFAFIGTLTLLSAWLLLSKPKQPKPSIEQQANA